VLFLASALLIVFLMGRLAWIQFAHGEELREMALATRMRDVRVEAKRGVVYDRVGRELALSVSVESVFALPTQVQSLADTARTLAEILDMDYDEILERVQKHQAFVWIARKISEEQAYQIKLLQLPGIDLTQESKRFYPKGRLGAHLLGIVGIDGQGLEGIELVYDRELRGVPGRIVIEYDARGFEMPQALHRYFPPQDGHNITLTVDEVIQFITERELQSAVARHQAKGGVVLVLDVKTGGVLASASWPTFDPTDYSDYPAENRRNTAFTDNFYPGSTFKPITIAAALEENVVSESDTFFCGGSTTVLGERISCWKAGGHGSQDLREVLKNSCNVGLIQIGQRLNIEKFYQYLDAFGLREQTGIDFPGEGTGIAPPFERATQIDLAVMSFGQTLQLTPLQLIRGIAAIANDGVLMEPYLAHSVSDQEGRIIWEREPTAVRQAVSTDTARWLQDTMEYVVSEGTGRNAQIEGYLIAGKTGTAQKSVGGRVSSERHQSYFVGFGPVNDPRLAILVMIDEPTGVYYGGLVAAPVFQAVMRDALHYLAIPPSPGAEERDSHAVTVVTVPDIIGLPLNQAKDRLWQENLSWVVSGDGIRVTDQTPPSGSQVPAGTDIIVSLGNQSNSDVVTVPDLTGETLRGAGELLSALGLQMQLSGTGLVVQQDPRPGVEVSKATVIRVYFQPPPP